MGIYLLGENLYQGVLLLIWLSYGLYSLISRPVSQRLGRRFERFEIVLGAILVVTSLLQAAVLAAEVFGWLG